MSDPSPAPEGTAAALIAAGLKLFGQKGFAATSTRELAAEATTNIASIAYHFGSKEGLRRACGAEVARRIGSVIDAATLSLPKTPEAACLQMEAAIRAMVLFVAGTPESGDLTAFMLREVAEEGPVLDTVYSLLAEPMHRRFCALWSIATGREAETDATRLLIFSIVGQVVYFRVGRRIVTRRMGWETLGPAEAKIIGDRLVENLRSILERERLT